MPEVTINGITISVDAGTNVVQAAEAAGQEIPHYCYHPGLSVAGNCRMCLVEIKALSAKQANPLPKLQIGCNTVVQDGMVVESDNERVREARRAVLEFLLVNHPVDCPICDQAGECKLQEYYMDYGRHPSRVALGDKVHKGKAIPIGPDVMLDQERCILCTRCIRFLDEVSKSYELTITERGDRNRLTLASGAWVDNPYAENIVDICPVGALTSKQFRFRARVWYLDAAKSICPGCATGCNIEVHSRKGTIYRTKPRYCPEVNGYWMCDYGRGVFRSNASADRLDTSMLREAGRFVSADYASVVQVAARSLRAAKRVAIVASASLSMEEGLLLYEIAETLGAGEKMLVSPAASDVADDGKLISGDRFPNRRGLLALGFKESSAIPEDVDAAIIARCDPSAGEEAWQRRLESLASTVVIDERCRETTAFADQVLAIASHFEQAGTFVNRQGRLQRYEASVAPPKDAVAGWRALSTLLAAVGGRVYDSFDEVLLRVAEIVAERSEIDASGIDWPEKSTLVTAA